jgi:hypothetical protein
MTKYFTVLATASLATLLALFAPAPVARADIFQWQYINPANPSLGKQRSTTLTAGGAGANAVPGANLSYRDLTMGYLIGADLTGAYGEVVILTNAELRLANLTNANFTAYFDENGGFITVTCPPRTSPRPTSPMRTLHLPRSLARTSARRT